MPSGRQPSISPALCPHATVLPKTSLHPALSVPSVLVLSHTDFIISFLGLLQNSLNYFLSRATYLLV